MSGGAFDYKQYTIREIADQIQRHIETNGQPTEYGEGYEYPPEIIAKFKEAAHELERAADMAQRVDWLLSGDDGDDSFLTRWEREVRKPYEEDQPQPDPLADRPQQSKP